ncbi:hypothetical protein BGZ83_005798 [Gryganskiella cystojenkinii]|nr:hypothetical protein BGZ83_005798 [Gryganskiella cystojenkinii]
MTAHESESTSSLLGPLLPTASSIRGGTPSRTGPSYVWDHEKLDLSLGDSNSSSMEPTTFYHSKTATVFSTSNSIESLHQYHQQLNPQQQQPNGNSSNSNNNHTKRPTTPSELLNENLALVQKNVLAQQEMISARSTQARLENQVYELDQNLAEARKEAQKLLRAKKDFDRQQEQSTAAFERERTLWVEREAELMRSLKFATRPLIVQAAKEDVDKDSAEDILPARIQQQIAENNAAHARALRGQEQLVTELRKQILNINQDMIERQRISSLRESELQAELAQAQELNKSLMEENESYQVLLHEKSMNGEFMQTSIMKDAAYNHDDPTATPIARITNGSINLADELGWAFDRSPLTASPITDKNEVETLRNELRIAKESNTAFSLYISKILTRIMEHPSLQAVLAADYSPRRASIPESPPAVISHVNNNKSSGSLNKTTDADISKTKDTKATTTTTAKAKPDSTRSRSGSLMSVFTFSSKSKNPPSVPANDSLTSKISNGSSNRSSYDNNDDDAASGHSSTQLTAFQEGHALEDASTPRTSYSSTEFTVVANDHTQLADYEPLTTFDVPFTRKEQLQRRQSALGSSSVEHERHQRRQTIGSASGLSTPTTGGGHGRYGSESNAQSSTQRRRSMHLKSKHSLNVLAPMPEMPSPEVPVPAIPAHHAQQGSDSMDSIQSPTLSISISEASTASGGTSAASTAPPSATTPTTPAVTEPVGTWTKVMRRMSFRGPAPAIVPKVEDTQSRTFVPEQEVST